MLTYLRGDDCHKLLLHNGSAEGDMFLGSTHFLLALDIVVAYIQHVQRILLSFGFLIRVCPLHRIRWDISFDEILQLLMCRSIDHSKRQEGFLSKTRSCQSN